eukprot:4199343-Prymnesium_polylepis.1
MPPPPSPAIPPSPPQVPDDLRPPESPPPPASPAPAVPPRFECADAATLTRFSVDGQLANCSALAAAGACTDASDGCEIKRTCPVSCGACQSCDAESTADVGVYVGGQLASCSQLASLQQCTHAVHGATVRTACPASCECGICPPSPPPFPPSPPSPPKAPLCATLIDLALILDASGSMQGYEEALRQFALGVLSQFELSSTEGRVGLITFSTTAVRLARQGPRAAQKMPSPRAARSPLAVCTQPSLCAAAEAVRARSFALCPSRAVGRFDPLGRPRGARNGDQRLQRERADMHFLRPRVGPNRPRGQRRARWCDPYHLGPLRRDAIAAAATVKSAGTTVIAVGFGSAVSSQTLEMMASPPSASHAYTGTDLADVQRRFADLCTIVASPKAPPSPILPPPPTAPPTSPPPR